MSTTITQHYDNAPIVEAIIDLRVELSPDFKVEELKKIYHSEEKKYPILEEVTLISGQIKMAAGFEHASEKEHVGFLLKNENKKQICNMQSKGFSLSFLAPYPTWENFSAEAKRLWALYQSVAQPIKINRLGVRYINRIDIPIPFQFDDYLNTMPKISDELPQVLSGYLMQLAMPFQDIHATALITQTTLPQTVPDKLSILLDLDVSIVEDFLNDNDIIWSRFEQLRNKKNLVFQACLTEKTKRMFD